MRQFEVGYLVVLTNGNSETIKSIRVWGNGAITLYFNLHDYCGDLDVKTIRKPRPGNAESRAIVAIAAKEYHSHLLFLSPSKDNKTKWKSFFEGRKIGLIISDAGRVYRKQKSMLK